MAKSVRFLGQSGFIITSTEGKAIVIDPWITGNPTCPLKLEDIKAAHLLLVTHDHFDHTASAMDIAKKTMAMVIAQPETIGRFKREAGLAEAQVVYGIGMNIGGNATVEGVTVTMVQAYHSSATGSACGYVIRLEDGTTIYHAGDTGIFEGMRLLRELYPLDLALLPIGGVFTMDAFQAAKALTLLKPKLVIPMHYKALPMVAPSPDEFVRLAKKEASGVKVIVLEPGQEYKW